MTDEISKLYKEFREQQKKRYLACANEGEFREVVKFLASLKEVK